MTTLREWWRSLAVTPAPLTLRERSILVAVTILAAITRWLSLSLTPWDWDEMLFMLSMRHYDVAAHHPHPPGFPLFVVAAKLVHRFGLSDFRSLQAIAFIGAIAIVPATFFLCRELRMRFAPSLGAATILAFCPNVWFYGGTAFSDVPSMTLVIVAIALLFRGCRDRRGYFAGALVLAIAGGFRPQNLLIGAVPAVIASVFQRWRATIIAALIGAAIVGGAYAVAAEKTGFETYREALAKHSAYITTTDSFRSPGRPALWRLFDDFFIRPYRAPLINTIVTLLGAISVVSAAVRLRPHILAIVAAFSPFCLFAWLMLDRFSVSRFSIGYAPMIAILAADGASILASEIFGRFGRRASAVVESTVVAVMLALMGFWTWPALRVVRTTISPPVAAAEWIRAHVLPTTKLYVHLGMMPYSDEFLSDLHPIYVTVPPTAAWSSEEGALYLHEDASNVSGVRNFVRERGRLWDLARQRYFEVSIRPLSESVVYGDGWYEEEAKGSSVWRWMGSRSSMQLPSIRGRSRLTLSLYAPLDALNAPPRITIRLNGRVVEQLHPTKSDVEFTRDVDSRADAPNELVIETDGVVRPADVHRSDARVLGLRLNGLGWVPVR